MEDCLLRHIEELEAENERLTACLAAFDVDPATLTADEAVRVYEQWQADWDQAARDSADATNLRAEVSRLKASFNALWAPRPATNAEVTS